MFNLVRVALLTLLLAFTASSIVGPAASSSMTIAMATGVAEADSTIMDCAEQPSSKIAMQGCDLLCNATATFAVASLQDDVFSELIFVLNELRVDVRADGRTLAYVPPPPRSFILT